MTHINMDEISLLFDMHVLQKVDWIGKETINVRTTGHKKTNFTCWLVNNATGAKPPLMGFVKRKTVLTPGES